MTVEESQSLTKNKSSDKGCLAGSEQFLNVQAIFFKIVFGMFEKNDVCPVRSFEFSKCSKRMMFFTQLIIRHI